MSTNKKSQKKQPNNIEKPVRRKFIDNSDPIPMFLLMLFLAIDLVPPFGAADVMASQWVYLGFVNLLSIAFIFWSKTITPMMASTFVRNSLSLTYLAFFLLAGLSIFFSANKIESIFVYSRLTIAISSFTVIGLFIISAIAFIQNTFIFSMPSFSHSMY